MKALLDLDRLLAEGEISAVQHDRLRRIARRETAALGYALLAGFGAIHFLTQWFERLGAEPGSVLIAGLLTLGIALGLRALNRGERMPD